MRAYWLEAAKQARVIQVCVRVFMESVEALVKRLREVEREVGIGRPLHTEEWRLKTVEDLEREEREA